VRRGRGGEEICVHILILYKFFLVGFVCLLVCAGIGAGRIHLSIYLFIYLSIIISISMFMRRRQGGGELGGRELSSLLIPPVSLERHHYV